MLSLWSLLLKPAWWNHYPYRWSFWNCPQSEQNTLEGPPTLPEVLSFLSSLWINHWFLDKFRNESFHRKLFHNANEMENEMPKDLVCFLQLSFEFAWHVVVFYSLTYKKIYKSLIFSNLNFKWQKSHLDVTTLFTKLFTIESQSLIFVKEL